MPKEAHGDLAGRHSPHLQADVSFRSIEGVRDVVRWEVFGRCKKTPTWEQEATEAQAALFSSCKAKEVCYPASGSPSSPMTWAGCAAAGSI